MLLGRLRRRLREQANPGDLTASQLSVLGSLERDGAATVSALARREHMRPQSMGATVAALQAAGHVSAAPDPADGRQTILSLTAQARDWIDAYRVARESWLSRAIAASLTPQEQGELARAIALLTRIVETDADGAGP